MKRVARQYLGARRIELDVAARRAGLASARSDRRPVEASCRWRVPKLAEVKDAFDRSVMPKLGPTPQLRRHPGSSGGPFPTVCELLIVERHELPIVTFDLIVKSGETSTPQGKEGLGSLAASLLDEGTKTRDSLQIAGEQAEIGATLATAGELESTTISLTTLTRHLERGLDLYADVILNPSFPEKELHRLKLQRLAQLKARADDAEQTAAAVFPRLIYGLGPSLRPSRRRDARLGPVDHPRRRRGVLQADHGAGQRRACDRRRRPAGCDHGGDRSPIADRGRPVRSPLLRRSRLRHPRRARAST